MLNFKSRVASLQKNVLFEKMKISQDPEKLTHGFL